MSLSNSFNRIRVIDSHTGGEPTRVVIEGGPDLGGGPLCERVERFLRDHDGFRSATVNEPRGNDAIVGALLCEPHDPDCAAGVIFYNNVGYLGMCGHGMIGVMATLRYLGRASTGVYRIETPPGIVEAHLHDDGGVTLRNVPSYRFASGVRLEMPDYGVLTGDIAWGGNWFFLVENHEQVISLDNLEGLTRLGWSIRRTLEGMKITGANGAEIDHIELFGPPSVPGADSKNFVLCPGGAYDRSPCGTGTSAKLACLYAAGKLSEGQIWRQESIVGSVFEGSVSVLNGQIVPSIRGIAFVNGEADLILDPNDPFCYGI